MRVTAVFVLQAALAVPAFAQAPPPWPTKVWAESSPEAQGLDRAPLEALHREFAEGRHGFIDGMLVMRNGAVVFERTYRGYGGQLLIVVPRYQLLAVFTGWNIYDRPSLSPALAKDRVLAAVKDRTRG